MNGRIELTPAQDRVLRLTAVHGMRRRTGWGAPIYLAGIHAFRPQPVNRLFDLRFLRVVKLGVEDTIEVSEAGLAYLGEHPKP